MGDYAMWGDFSVYASAKTFRRAMALVVCSVCCGPAIADSPPLITDDPETPGAGGWEINITSSIETTPEATVMEVPLFDINYGFVENDQLKVEFAVVRHDPRDQDNNWGISDLLVGYKYRFLDENDHGGWAVSFYPQVSSPTGNADLGIGSGSTEMQIPFEFQKHFCNEQRFCGWINPEVGYNIVFEDDTRNSWKFGLAAAWELPNKLELLGEVGTLIFPQGTESDNPFFNFGVEYPLNKNVVLLGSAGRGFRNRQDTPDFFALLGFQFLFGAAAGRE